MSAFTWCEGLQRSQLTDPIDIAGHEGLDFFAAKRLADAKAGEVARSPMLLAWYEKGSGMYSPRVECCGGDKPTWLVFAESRGGNITIDVNKEDYVFVYGDFS